MKRKYPSDVSREAFERIQPILGRARKKTKPQEIDVYEVFCGVLYVLKSGCQWRMLPSDFPSWQSCYAYYRKWSAKREASHSLLEEALKKCGWRGETKPWPERKNQLHHR
jgi:transposase